jgi:hypothetical protein
VGHGGMSLLPCPEEGPFLPEVHDPCMAQVAVGTRTVLTMGIGRCPLQRDVCYITDAQADAKHSTRVCNAASFAFPWPWAIFTLQRDPGLPGPLVVYVRGQGGGEASACLCSPSSGCLCSDATNKGGPSNLTNVDCGPSLSIQSL